MIKIKYGFALTSSLGPEGIEEEKILEMEPRLKEICEKLHELQRRKEVGFLDLPYQDVTPIEEIAREIRNRYAHFVLIGIGGSFLGAATLYNALKGTSHNQRPNRGSPTFYILDNADPTKTTEILENIDLHTTCFNVVSKSGSTAESMANFLVALARLKEKVGKDAARKSIVFTTDPEKGALRRLAREEGFKCVDVPPNVGGRFSVLSPVGLLPAAVLGINIHSLLEGASQMKEGCEKESIFDNPAWLLASIKYLHHIEKGHSTSVMMPYCERLASFADWYRQLWAESLGKKGKGQTPVKSLGAIDQHSQIQLYNQGPRDKIITFIEVRYFPADIRIPGLYPHIEELSYLGGHSMAELLNKELEGTASALTKSGIPHLTISIDRLDEKHLGALFMLYEITTAIAGGLYAINPFDQPGVEEGKRLTYGLMGRKGFEEKAREVAEIRAKGERSLILEI